MLKIRQTLNRQKTQKRAVTNYYAGHTYTKINKIYSNALV